MHGLSLNCPKKCIDKSQNRGIIHLKAKNKTYIRLKEKVIKMSAKNIYIDCRSSLAYENLVQPEENECRVISMTTKADIRKKREIERNERLFTLAAAGAMLLCDGFIFGLILKVGRLIGLQTGSFTAAGCYLVGAGFLMLTFLESASKQKRSAFLDGMAHIWGIICCVSAVTLIVYSAFRSPDSGGSIIMVSLIGAAMWRYFKS